MLENTFITIKYAHFSYFILNNVVLTVFYFGFEKIKKNFVFNINRLSAGWQRLHNADYYNVKTRSFYNGIKIYMLLIIYVN